ncbi:MAG TPA: 3-hydroxybutyryl-CoA dehydrogenase [Alphaproteobacteria bacterium]
MSRAAGRRERIVAVGAGRMGRGIAQVFAYAGYPATVVDLKPRPAADAKRLLAEARAEIQSNLGFLASLGVITKSQAKEIVGRVAFAAADEAAEAIGAADVVFEGVPEVLDVKREALGTMSALARPDAILASTTSTMLVNTLADFVDGPARFLNAHWLNPAYLIPLVEVSPGDATDPAVVERLMALLERVGKVPVKCKASPGYIVPRIQSVAMSEAVRMYEEGVASPEDIDRAVQVGFGVRYATMGLLEFLDWGGVDILYYANSYLKGALNGDRFELPAIIPKMMAEGRKGMREGRGIYDFRNIDVAEFQRDKLSKFVKLLRATDLLPAPAGAGCAKPKRAAKPRSKPKSKPKPMTRAAAARAKRPMKASHAGGRKSARSARTRRR